VQSLLQASIAKGEGAGARLGRRPTILVAGLTGAAVLAVTAVAALPSVAPSGQATAARPSIKAQPSVFVAKAVAQIQQAASESDPGSRRFTGQVGDNLSQSLAAAGVPELQGREYVALLSRAIKLQEGLSVDDRFDLVLQRGPDGSLGQLLYAGMDRVARADVELMKWTDGKHIIWVNADGVGGDGSQTMGMPVHGHLTSGFGERSEERRVGKECRSRWSPYH